MDKFGLIITELASRGNFIGINYGNAEPDFTTIKNIRLVYVSGVHGSKISDRFALTTSDLFNSFIANKKREYGLSNNKKHTKLPKPERQFRPPPSPPSLFTNLMNNLTNSEKATRFKENENAKREKEKQAEIQARQKQNEEEAQRVKKTQIKLAEAQRQAQKERKQIKLKETQGKTSKLVKNFYKIIDRGTSKKQKKLISKIVDSLKKQIDLSDANIENAPDIYEQISKVPFTNKKKQKKLYGEMSVKFRETILEQLMGEYVKDSSYAKILLQKDTLTKAQIKTKKKDEKEKKHVLLIHEIYKQKEKTPSTKKRRKQKRMGVQGMVLSNEAKRNIATAKAYNSSFGQFPGESLSDYLARAREIHTTDI